MNEKLKSEMTNLGLEAYDRGRRDVIEILIASFDDLKKTGVEALSIDQIKWNLGMAGKLVK